MQFKNRQVPFPQAVSIINDWDHKVFHLIL
jgi:hypothetical protein